MACPSCYLTNKTSCTICGFKSTKTVDTNIYILELKNNKYYIGKTNNPTFRLEQHFNSEPRSGSAWTKKYNPIRVIEIIPNCDDFDEDKWTLKYMSMHGINNVRGGSFCQIELSEENINTINRMINGSTDKCYKCSGNHFHSFCNVNINISTKYTCFRCLRDGHSSDDCYAKTDKNGEELLTFGCEYVDVYCCDYCGKEFETEKGARFHENVHCNKKTKQTTKSSKNKCFRCGRENHYADECYASKHINGKNL
jgi:hypothetical protein